jgi:hypothetical protein
MRLDEDQQGMLTADDVRTSIMDSEDRIFEEIKRMKDINEKLNE